MQARSQLNGFEAGVSACGGQAASTQLLGHHSPLVTRRVARFQTIEWAPDTQHRSDAHGSPDHEKSICSPGNAHHEQRRPILCGGKKKKRSNGPRRRAPFRRERCRRSPQIDLQLPKRSPRAAVGPPRRPGGPPTKDVRGLGGASLRPSALRCSARRPSWRQPNLGGSGQMPPQLSSSSGRA